jgi:hypothetical protein
MDEELVVIPLPTDEGKVTYAVARLVSEGEERFAQALYPVPGTPFVPERRVSLSRRALARIRAGSVGRPHLYLYEGMILAPPATPSGA